MGHYTHLNSPAETHKPPLPMFVTTVGYWCAAVCCCSQLHLIVKVMFLISTTLGGLFNIPPVLFCLYFYF